MNFPRDSAYSQWSRRSILLKASQATLGALALRSKRVLGDETPIDCLVLGAGIAGLTAAWQLNDWWRGTKKIVVLEGSDRLGGRIQTLRGVVPGPPASNRGESIELGAEFIHRAPGTVPLWNYIHHFKLQTRRIPKMSGSRIFYPKHPLFAGGRRPEAAALLWNLFQASDLYSKIDRHRGPDLAAREWAEKYHSILNLDQGLGEDFVSMVLTGHMPGTLDDLSVRGFSADRLASQLKESDEYALINGYDSIIGAMARPLDIRRNCRVTRVEYGLRGSSGGGGRGGVTVTTDDNRVFSARAAVCTFSIGMLRSNQVEFSPDLPREKKEALAIIKPGFHSKVIISFTRRFWKNDMTMAHFPLRERRAGRTYFRLFNHDPDMPPTLTALMMGDDAKRLDPVSNKEIIQAICFDLDQMFPHAAPTIRHVRFIGDEPQILRKAWMQDPWSLGGNSYISTDAALGPRLVRPELARTALAECSSTPGLFWAGEATALATQPASVHGANESGLRAAREVFRFVASLHSDVRD